MFEGGGSGFSGSLDHMGHWTIRHSSKTLCTEQVPLSFSQAMLTSILLGCGQRVKGM